MATRKPRSSGPEYGMVSFVGSRQPAGPSPRALELLHEARIQVATPEPARAPEPSRVQAFAPEPVPVLAPTPASEPVLATKSPAGDGMALADPLPADAPSRAPRRAPATSRRAKPASGDSYALPAPGTSKPKARSNHFRLPADVEAHLRELAATHGCSRTRVVCSAITSEWQRLHRRRARAARTDEK